MTEILHGPVAITHQRGLPRGTKIWSRDGKVQGTVTGATRRCQLDGCGGIRIRVDWPVGGRTRFTWPCTKGISFSDTSGWRVGEPIESA